MEAAEDRGDLRHSKLDRVFLGHLCRWKCSEIRQKPQHAEYEAVSSQEFIKRFSPMIIHSHILDCRVSILDISTVF